MRPFGTATIFENRLYIQTGKSKNIFNKADGVWLCISATLVPDERVEAKEFNLWLNDYSSLKSVYSATDNNTLVLYLKDVTATFYSFANDPREIKF